LLMDLVDWQNGHLRWRLMVGVGLDVWLVEQRLLALLLLLKDLDLFVEALRA
jgi:hypothetical protein